MPNFALPSLTNWRFYNQKAIQRYKRTPWHSLPKPVAAKLTAAPRTRETPMHNPTVLQVINTKVDEKDYGLEIYYNRKRH